MLACVPLTHPSGMAGLGAVQLPLLPISEIGLELPHGSVDIPVPV